jgi:hypothetical protein
MKSRFIVIIVIRTADSLLVVWIIRGPHRKVGATGARIRSAGAQTYSVGASFIA